MKQLAVFCDGTWATLDQERRLETKGARAETNVALLYRVFAAKASNDDEAGYFSGVGVGRMPLLGAIVGAGLDDKIAEAFSWLCERYRPGDRVALFGFSRGAYTARSLAGLIRNVGYLKSPSKPRVREAMALYRSAEGPDAPSAVAFRERHAAAFVEKTPQGPRLMAPGGQVVGDHAVHFLGVWDTVGALGVPARAPFAPAINRRFAFHDTALSRLVAHGAHALAADERRVVFEPAAWSNLAALNAGLAAPRYVQAWFPGDHGSVGGGGAERRLSDGALVWMAEQAAAAGVRFEADHAELVRARAGADPVAGPLTNIPGKPWRDWSKQGDRAPMQASDVPAPSALRRMAADADYRPAPLKRVWPG